VDLLYSQFSGRKSHKGNLQVKTCVSRHGQIEYRYWLLYDSLKLIRMSIIVFTKYHSRLVKVNRDMTLIENSVFNIKPLFLFKTISSKVSIFSPQKLHTGESFNYNSELPLDSTTKSVKYFVLHTER
jgi:hypothetical protein